MPDLEALLDDHAGVLVSDGSVSMLVGMVTTDFADAGRSYGGATQDTVFEIGQVVETFGSQFAQFVEALELTSTILGEHGAQSTADDMTMWLQAQCNPVDWPMTDEICALTGWETRESPWPLSWRCGRAGSDSAFLGWHPPTGSGVVLLASTESVDALMEAGVNIIGEIVG